MVLIPAGSFEMGDSKNEPEEWMEDARPEHTGTLDAFYMNAYEVTNAQYSQFVRATEGYRKAEYWDDDDLNQANQSVVGVSWNDATAYAEWVGKRLPTEAEWEHAARGGLEGQRYPWGNKITYDNANFSGTGGIDQWDKCSPVGSFAANGYGLYDMAGNVWEWCQDRFADAYYIDSPVNNPQGPETGGHRVLRGGSWSTNTTYPASSSSRQQASQ